METDLFGQEITPTQPAKKTAAGENKKPSTNEQKVRAGIGIVDPVLCEELVGKAKMGFAPGLPVKADGILNAGPTVEWFPRRGQGRLKILLVSAYPSDEERRMKRVLVGPSGSATSQALADLGIDMEKDCWITNVIRYYFPPKTNVPAIAIEQCKPYLDAEIAHLKPDLVLCLGGLALKALLGDGVSLDDYRGERVRPEGKTYDVAAVWQPAYVLREPETFNVWRDDLAFVLGKKPLPKGAKEWKDRDELPKLRITNKRELKAAVSKILQLDEKIFCIDTEYYGENPNAPKLLRFQMATASLNLMLVLRQGHWKPRIYAKSLKKGTRELEIPPRRILDTIIEKGYDQASEETGRSLASLLSLTLSETHEAYFNTRWEEHLEEIRRTKGNKEATAAAYAHEEQTYRAMKDGNVLVFDEQSELEEYLMEHEKLRTNLIAYVIGADYVFDCSEKEIGDILRPLFTRPGVCVRGHNANVDWTRIKAAFGLELAPLQDVDTMLLALILDEGQPRGLENLSKRYNNAPNHKLPLLEHMSRRGLKDKAYCFAKPDILDPYSFTDSRRNYDMVDPMLESLNEETCRVLAKLDDCRVPLTNPGEAMYKAKQWRSDLQVNNWGNLAQNLSSAFFSYKMGQYQALVEPMQIGQPFNAKKTQELIDWYERVGAAQVKKCQAEVAKVWKNPNKPDEVKTDFNVQSGDECAFLLYYILGHRPFKTTGNKNSGTKPMEWNDKLHEEWIGCIKAGRKSKIRPATDAKDLETLAEKEPMAKLIGDTRTILTIIKNYMRKGGRWKDKTISIRKKSAADEAEMSAPFFLESLEDDQLDDKIAEELEALPESGADWEEYKKDQTSRSISLLISDDNRIYSCYFPTLETQRLATVPNVSAIIRDESRYVTDIVGEKPPCNIRQLNEGGPEWFISSNDWKAAEVYMIGVLSHWRSIKRGKEQSNLLEIIRDPKRCVHASTARKMFPKILGSLSDMEIKDTFPHLRELAKPVVFGIPYGRGAKAIAVDLNRNAINQWMEKIARGEKADKPVAITTEQAQGFIDAYFELAPEAWDFLQEQMSLVHNPGFQVNPWGFVRRYPNLTAVKDVSELERQAANWQIQGGVACAMMQTCIKWNEEYKRRYTNMPMFLIDILHDATKFLFHKSMLPYHEEIIQDIQGPGLHLPFNPPIPLQVEPTIYHAYEKKEYSPSIKLEDPANPDKHKKTFLGKYGDTPENRAFFAQFGAKSDFARFVKSYTGETDCLTAKGSLHELLTAKAA